MISSEYVNGDPTLKSAIVRCEAAIAVAMKISVFWM
jgi:hypothetical protein